MFDHFSPLMQYLHVSTEEIGDLTNVLYTYSIVLHSETTRDQKVIAEFFFEPIKDEMTVKYAEDLIQEERDQIARKFTLEFVKLECMVSVATCAMNNKSEDSSFDEDRGREIWYSELHDL
jgi:hypothetical protein